MSPFYFDNVMYPGLNNLLAALTWNIFTITPQLRRYFILLPRDANQKKPTCFQKSTHLDRK